MNLKELRKRIKTYTDYAPENFAYDRDLDDIINDAYNRLWLSHRWTFATRDSWIEVFPDLSHNNTGLTCSFTDGQRLVDFGLGAEFNFIVHRRKFVEGNIIELFGREYTISKVIDDRRLAVTEPIRIVDTSGTSGEIEDYKEWRIKFRFYNLPKDCLDILGLAQRDAPTAARGSGGNPPFGKIQQLSQRHDQEFGLRQDQTNPWATAYVPVTPTIVPSAFKLEHEWIDNSNNPHGITGDFDDNTDKFYEVAWAFVSPDGSVGSLSEPHMFERPSSSGTSGFSLFLHFLTFDDKPVQSPATTASYSTGTGLLRRFEGMRKRLFYNSNIDPSTGRRLGSPCWQQMITGTAQINTEEDVLDTEDTDATATVTSYASFAPGTARWNWNGRMYNKIRPFPRISDESIQYDFVGSVNNIPVDPTVPARNADYFKRLEIIYHRSPQPLRLDTDTPELPHEGHHVVFQLALADVLRKNGDITSAREYERQAQIVIDEMARRFTIRQDNNWRLGKFGETGEWQPYDFQSLRRI